MKIEEIETWLEAKSWHGFTRGFWIGLALVLGIIINLIIASRL